MATESSIEKVWKTAEGFKAFVVLNRGSHRCGYVGLPATHALHGLHYGTTTGLLKDCSDEPIGKRSLLVIVCSLSREGLTSMDIAFDVHGGVTWSGYFNDMQDNTYKEAGIDNDGLWYIGFDCAHAGDGLLTGGLLSDGPVRSLSYCEDQCNSLSKQIVEKLVTPINDGTLQA